MLFAAKWAKTGDIIANAGIVFVSVQANIPYFTCINHSFIFFGGGIHKEVHGGQEWVLRAKRASPM